MATIINNPPGASPPAAPADSGSGMGMILGIILTVGVVFLFIAFVLPMLRGSQRGESNNSSPTINVPYKIDVNIKK